MKLILSLLMTFASAADRNDTEKCNAIYEGLSRYRGHIQAYLRKHGVDFIMVDNGFQITPNSRTALNIYALKRKLVDKKDVWLVPYISRNPTSVDPFLARLGYDNPALNILIADVLANGLNNANYHALKNIEK